MKIRNSYLERNKYLDVYDIAPRSFGQMWGEPHLNGVIPELLKPSKKYDPDYTGTGEYDFWYDGIRIEVKSSRVVKNIAGKSLSEKALNSESKDAFVMNFQQLKPSCCDIFVWIAVWTDKIKYWVLTSNEVKNSPHFSNQHRKESTKEKKFEGQIFMTKDNIHEFDKYEVGADDILSTIIRKYRKEKI